MSATARTRDPAAPEPRLTFFASNRVEILLDRLAETMSTSPLGPLEREVIVVQSRGMYRWLTLELAGKLDIAAGLATPFPGVFCRALIERVEGTTQAAPSERYEPSTRSVYDPDLLTWRLFALLGAHDTGGERHADAYLRDDPDQQKRYQLSLRLAQRFDEYQLYRSDLIAAWESNRQPITATEYRDTAEWQAHLWRTVTGSARSAGDVPPLARANAVIARLCEPEAATAGLPPRVHLFGVNALPPLQLRLFAALARHVPVMVYVVEPTPQYWGDLVSERVAQRYEERTERLNLPALYAHADVGNPLLSALGRQGRDFHDLLLDADEHGSAWTPLSFETPKRTSLLGNLQADIAELIDRKPVLAPETASTSGAAVGTDSSSTAPLPFRDTDRSLQVHVCHSPMREMEVLRDVLLDAFARDPGLRPHDVFVLAPDITTYAPYVEAVFGADRRWPETIPFTIADRSPRYEQPTVEAAQRILALIGSRVPASAVIDLLDFDAVRNAAGIAAEEAGTLRHWVRDANIRWGVDGDHRRVLRVPGDDVDTWRAGLDRLLMGYAVATSDTLVSGILPLTHGAADPELLGRGLTFFDRLLAQLRALHAPRPLDAWANDLRSMLDGLLASESEQEQIALRSLLDHVDDLALGRTLAGVDEPVHIETVRAHLRQRMDGTAGGAGFLTGAVTFCALQPLRAIPAKIICIVGLSEGTVPRLERRASFDLMAAERRRCDRSQRDEDRYVFLETILAARDRLILSYVGRSQKDNSELAPSILVSELLDCIDRSFVTDNGASVRERIVTRHPLQPFSARYFVNGDAPDAQLFSYSQANRRAAEAAAAPTREPALFCPSPLAEVERHTEVSLKELSDALVNPSKHFCRDVLGIRLPEDESALEDVEPFGLDALARYKLVAPLVKCYLAGAPTTRDKLEAIRAAGALPHAGFGRAYLRDLDAEARELAGTVSRFTGPPPVDITAYAVDLTHADWRITGLIESITPNCLVRFRPAKIKPKDKLAIWVEHLVACALRRRGDAASAALPADTVLIGKDQCMRLTPVAEPEAELGRMVELYREGLRRPLALFEAASYAFAEQQWALERPRSKSRKDPQECATAAFRGREGLGSAPGARGDVDDVYVALCTRDRDPLTEDATDFKRWAWELWRPFFEHAEEASS